MGELIKITPDRIRAKSIFKMAMVSFEMIKTIDEKKFPSNVVKGYYDVIRELISAIVLIDGYKTYGEGAHKKLIDYFFSEYKEFFSSEIFLVNELRILRNKIDYDGFFVKYEYLERKNVFIKDVIEKLIKLVEKKL
jgi:hypothetical protein